MSTEDGLAAALNGAFGGEAPPPSAPVEAAPEPDDALPVVEPVEAEEAPVVEAAPEPEFEVEVEGNREIVKGADKIKELIQKGLHYGRGSEEVARAREQIAAQAQTVALQAQFQQAIITELSELRGLDQQLEQWNKVDWAAAFDADPFNAMKLREQRDSLREQRAAKFNELNAKQQQFVQAHSQAVEKTLVAESAALLAKLPEWRNSEVATQERASLAKWLGNQGYTPQELSNLNDHRAVVIARKAFLYDQLQSDKAGRVKQAREAPPVVKPGAAPNPQVQGRQSFKQFRAGVIKAGKSGNNRAAEEAVTAVFNKLWK